MQILAGCGGPPPNMESFVANLKDPQILVGKYFEAGAGQPLFGALQSDRYEGTMSLVKSNPAEGKKDLQDRLAEGAFIDINQGLNPEQEKAKLIFEIIEAKQYEASKDLFFKIRLFNKKYMDTEWWVYSSDFGKVASPTISPIRDEVSGKPADKASSPDAHEKSVDKTNSTDVHETSVDKANNSNTQEKSADKANNSNTQEKSADKTSNTDVQEKSIVHENKNLNGVK